MSNKFYELIINDGTFKMVVHSHAPWTSRAISATVKSKLKAGKVRTMLNATGTMSVSVVFNGDRIYPVTCEVT